MVYISQAAIDEVGRVSEAVARAQRPKKRTFELVIETHTEAFGDDAWDREVEVARILRAVSEALYGNLVESKSARLRDRNKVIVGHYEFKEDE
jgi:hypothetical protein